MITILNLMKRVCKSNRVNNALKEAQTKEKANTKSKSTLVPKGWFVSEAGQNPLHMLWFVVLVSFDDIAGTEGLY